MSYILQDGNSYSQVLTDENSEIIINRAIAGEYTINIIAPSEVEITLVGGGGGSGQVDGGTDSYSDTAWAEHYGHNGGGGGYFHGIAHLTKGTLKVTVGGAGVSQLGSSYDPNAVGYAGEDSYAVFTPENGSPVEIARAKGGQCGSPYPPSYSALAEGGKVTYNSSYFPNPVEAIAGEDGGIPWAIHI